MFESQSGKTLVPQNKFSMIRSKKTKIELLILLKIRKRLTYFVILNKSPKVAGRLVEGTRKGAWNIEEEGLKSKGE